MKFLHISPSSARMMDTYVKMLRKHYPEEEHRFLYWDTFTEKDRLLLDYGNSIEIQGTFWEKFRIVAREMKAADYIVWHGLMHGAKRMLFMSIFRKFLKKSIWVMYGIDLYNWKIEGHGLKTLLVNAVNRYSRKNIPYVGIISEVDRQEYCRQFGNKAKLFYVPYPISEASFDSMEKHRDATPRTNGKLYVQVSHNAFVFNRHLDTLESLEHFKDEDMRVIIPLSYGNSWYNSRENYAETVEKRATEIFGDKSECLFRLMPASEYTALLCNIDVAIFGANRQNALGNILKSLYVGNKVFLSTENPLYGYFTDKGIQIFPAEDIADMSYEEFREHSPSQTSVDWIRKTYHPDANIFYWNVLLDHCKKRSAILPGTEQFERLNLAAVKEAFAEYDLAERRIQKQNYVNLTKYGHHPKGTKFVAIQDVLIVGAESMGLRVYWDMMKQNMSGTKWNIEGFVSDDIQTTKKAAKCDVICSVEQLTERLSAIEEDEEGKNIVLSVMDPEKRAKLYEQLSNYRCNILTYIDKASSCSVGVVLGDGCILVNGTHIDAAVSVGVCTQILGTTIGVGTTIGDFCMIASGCVIGDDVVIGDHVQIEENCTIDSGVVIPSGSRIRRRSNIEANSVSGEND